MITVALRLWMRDGAGRSMGELAEMPGSAFALCISEAAHIIGYLSGRSRYGKLYTWVYLEWFPWCAYIGGRLVAY